VNIAWLLIFLFGMIFLEVPIIFAIPLSSFIYIWLDGSVPFYLVSGRIASGLESFVLLAVPLFILAGNLLNTSGIASRIFNFAQKTVGHIDGGLGHVNVIASVIFAGMSGVAQADAAGLGAIEVREMRRVGFSSEFSAAITAVSAIIGPIIPPSVMMIVYSVLADVSTPELFMAGVVPGCIMALLLMVAIWTLVRMGKVYAPKEKAPSFREWLRALKDGFWALMAPAFLLFGILTGFATPTELGAMTCCYAIILGLCYRELSIKKFMISIYNTVISCGVMVSIVSMAVPYSGVLAVKQVPEQLSALVLGFGNEPWVVLLIVNIVLLFLGCVMESTAILLITVPVFVPIMKNIGVDPVHFGVVMVINLLIGTITPPFGVLIFVMMDVAKVEFRALVKAITPFYIPVIVCLGLITFWPEMVLWLPNILFR
jgi:tripartite ATP-independent transporter DctM subunit